MSLSKRGTFFFCIFSYLELCIGIFFLDNLADITHALQRLTEAPPVASLSSAVSRATSRISAIGDGSLDEYPIPGKLLSEILQVKCLWES